MGMRLIKQPNGLYARFSTICGEFSSYNQTLQEIIEEVREEAADEAEENILRVASRIGKKQKRPNQIFWKEALEEHNERCEPDDRITEEEIQKIESGEGVLKVFIVRGDHPVLSRQDKIFYPNMCEKRTKESHEKEARAYADELIKSGYENVEVELKFFKDMVVG